MSRYEYERLLTPDSPHNSSLTKKTTLNFNNINNNNNNNSSLAATNNNSNSNKAFRSPSHSHQPSSKSKTRNNNNNNNNVLLQWGQRKTPTLSPSQFNTTPPSFAVSPPSSSAPITSNSRFNHIRNLEERIGAGNNSPSRKSPNHTVSRSTTSKPSPTTEKVDKKFTCSGTVKDDKVNGSSVQADVRVDLGSTQSEQQAEPRNVATVGQKANGVIQWPRIYVALSRKEKEEDFMSLRGTKLPHRPKKRPKNVDRSLQYCFPGMWLPDLTKSRYEVREKKYVKKQKRRGLKGMESMDSGSD
ncbi:hypothetical protein ACFE04_002596 [Oxalis oulophora]